MAPISPEGVTQATVRFPSRLSRVASGLVDESVISSSPVASSEAVELNGGEELAHVPGHPIATKTSSRFVRSSRTAIVLPDLVQGVVEPVHVPLEERDPLEPVALDRVEAALVGAVVAPDVPGFGSGHDEPLPERTPSSSLGRVLHGSIIDVLPSFASPLELARLRPDARAGQVTTHTHERPPFDGKSPLDRVGHRDYQTIPADGGTWSFPELEGPGVVTTLWMALAQSQLGPLLRLPVPAQRHLWLHVWYDGHEEPAISAPIGHFFGNGTTRNVHFQSRLVGITSGGYFSFLPMPFTKSCRLTVENRHKRKAVRFFFGSVGFHRLAELPEDVGYLRAQFHARTFAGSRKVSGDQVPNDPHVVLEVAGGAGHYIGQTLTLFPTGLRSRLVWPYVGFPYLEGNLKVRVDDEVDDVDMPVVAKPLGSPHGHQCIEHTGVEDYALSAWYFQRAPFAALWHGCSVRSWLTGAVSLFRFHEFDPCPWNQRIKMTLTHGEFDDVDCRMESLAFYYGRRGMG